MKAWDDTVLVAVCWSVVARSHGAVAQQQLRRQTRDEKIVGGVLSPAYPSFGTSAGNTVCGGTLIHPDIFLTAAHCSGDFNDGIFIGGTSYYGAGSLTVSASDVAYEIIHEGYQPGSTSELHDIMLVKLSRKVTEKPIQALNLDGSAEVAPGGTITAIGHGKTQENGSVSELLQKVDLQITTHALCVANYGWIVENKSVCAMATGKDTCQGDSGGPIFNANNVQVGITSYGIGCARPNIPGVYVRLSGYGDWIKQKICQHASDKPQYCIAIPAPTLAPVATAPLAAPTTPSAPVSAPVQTPVASPMAAPVSSPAQAPVATAPVATPSTPSMPASAPVQTPVTSPVSSPAQAPVTAPVAAPTTPSMPVSAPVQTPVTSPMAAPVNSPAQAPVTAPVAAPTTRSPVNSPTQPPAQIEPAPSPPVCFSSQSFVNVKDIGAMFMDKLKVGDLVEVADGKFEPVYTFFKRSTSITGEYLQIYFEHDEERPLEISSNHLVFIFTSDGVTASVPASHIKIGSTVWGKRGAHLVTKIDIVHRGGAYAPYTLSGTVVVNDVVASSYATAPGMLLNASHEALHFAQSLHRLACRTGLCQFETYSEDGTTMLSQVSIGIYTLVERQHSPTVRYFWRCLLLLAVVGLWAVDILVAGATRNPWVVLLVMSLIWWQRRLRLGKKNDS